MDNRHIDVTSEGEDSIKHALALVWPNAAGGKATHYVSRKYRYKTDYYAGKRDDGTEYKSHYTQMEEHSEGIDTLILLWHNEGKSMSLPFPIGLGDAANFIKSWLSSIEYKHEPDHDGDNHKGWRIFNESWGHVAEYHYAIVAAQPAWAMYGK